jgi:thioredoxin 1
MGRAVDWGAASTGIADRREGVSKAGRPDTHAGTLRGGVRMSENVMHVGDQDFQEMVLSSKVPVLVDFWAEWCTPCHMVSPIVEEIARENVGSLKTAKLNVDDNPMVAGRYGVMSIPTLILFKDGQETARVIGARGKDAILREIMGHIAA